MWFQAAIVKHVCFVAVLIQFVCVLNAKDPCHLLPFHRRAETLGVYY